MKKSFFTFRIITVGLLAAVLVLGLVHQHRQGYTASANADAAEQDNASIVTLVKIF
jgi:hypothetical protein